MQTVELKSHPSLLDLGDEVSFVKILSCTQDEVSCQDFVVYPLINHSNSKDKTDSTSFYLCMASTIEILMSVASEQLLCKPLSMLLARGEQRWRDGGR